MLRILRTFEAKVLRVSLLTYRLVPKTPNSGTILLLFSNQVVSNSLWPHGVQLPCPDLPAPQHLPVVVVQSLRVKVLRASLLTWTLVLGTPNSGTFLLSLLFSHSVLSDSLWPHGLQHSRLPCPSLFPRVCSNSCLFCLWFHPTISSSVIPFSSCLQSCPESGCFPVSQLLASGGQSIGASTSASVLPMNIQGWFPLGLTGLISLQSKGLSRVFSSTTVGRHQIFSTQSFLLSSSHIHTWPLEKL